MCLRQRQRQREAQRREAGPRPGRPSGEAGFTLVETSISLGVMMVAALGVAALFVHSINNNAGAGDRARAMAVAQHRIERLRSVEFDDIADEDATVVSDGRSYTVETNVTAVDTDDDVDGQTMKRIEVRVTPQAVGGEWAGGTVVLWTERAALTLGDNR